MATVSNADVDKAFYDSHTDSAGNLDASLVGSDGKPRKLTKSAADAAYVQEWIKIRKHLQEVADCAAAGGGAPVGGAVAGCAAPKKDADAPALDLSKWNDGDGAAIQGSTNCYAYAMDSRTGHTVGETPQPGTKAGSPPASWSCPDYSAAVLADGKSTVAGQPDSILSAPQCPYQKQNQLPPPKKSGYYLVALVMTSNSTDKYDSVSGLYRESDYHWYRQDDNGLWSQKQGTTPAKNTDESDNLITNPQTCDRTEFTGTHTVPGVGTVPSVLDYDVFCGYFYVKKGGADVEG